MNFKINYNKSILSILNFNMKMLPSILLLSFLFNILNAACDGFNWYHDIDPEECYFKDIAVLQTFIENSGDSLLIDMDTNFNGKIEPLELGWQFWEDGRLIHLICQEVPSPYYLYEYNCGLTGKIPENIGNLSALVKLRIDSNNLIGEIPQSICELNIVKHGPYWFNIENNQLCPPYPNCLINKLDKQDIKNCK